MQSSLGKDGSGATIAEVFPPHFYITVCVFHPSIYTLPIIL